MKIVLNKFAEERHTPKSGLSFCRLSSENFVQACNAWANAFQPSFDYGYREGVLLLNVPEEALDDFVCNIVKITKDTPIIGVYESRVEGEEPRMSVKACWTVPSLPACSAQIVLYRNDVLAETDQNDTDPEEGEVWEIVSINVSPYETPTPIPPMAAIYNHLGMSGGSQSRMSNLKFVDQLRASMNFWKDHVFVAPSPF